MRRSFLRVESLESRNLLSGSPWQNPMSCNDLDNDGTVSASDVLTAINAINAGGSGNLSGKATAPTLSGGSSDYVDANGDGDLSASDVLSVINAINTGHPDAPPQNDLPDTDQQADAIDPSIPALPLDNGFARVKAELNAAGDVDVFKVVAATTSLNFALFSKTAGISVAIEDSTGAAIGSATNDPTTRHPASVTATVDVGSTYYIVVSGTGGTTGEYCVQVIDNGKALPPPPGKDGSGDQSGDTGESGDTSDDSGHHAPPPMGDGGDDGDTGDTTDGSDDTGKPPLPPPPPKPADVFAKLDTDSSGSLSLDEFSALPPPKDATATPADVFAKFDANSDGALSLDEFTALFAKPTGGDDSDGGDSGDDDAPPPGAPPTGSGGHGDPSSGGAGQTGSGPTQGGPTQGGSGPQTPPSPDDVFKHLDANSDGSLSATEFATFREPPGVTTALDKLFASWDTDGNSLLSLSEFDLGFATFKKS
ncbi:MAG TPA: dockerin type I domain-containing protein [Pirellulaceae bacterium]